MRKGFLRNISIANKKFEGYHSKYCMRSATPYIHICLTKMSVNCKNIKEQSST